jgi:MFS family permease
VTQLSAEPRPSWLVRVCERAPLLLRENRDFRLYWAGQSISLFGDQITELAVPLAGVLVLHANAAQMGYLTAAGLAPNLLFALHAGAWVDRRGRRRQVMIAADLARAALLATVPIFYAFGALSLLLLYVVAFLAGTCTVVFFVSASSLFVALVPREQFMQGTSLLYGSRAFSFVAGPSVAGVLVQVLSAPVTLLADACSFVVSALFLRRISPREPATEESASGHVVAGARYIRRSATVRSCLAATATINFFGYAVLALLILYATRYLHVRAAVLGTVLGAGAIGGLIGSAVTTRIGRRIGVGPAFLLGCVLFPAPILLIPLAGGPHALVLAMLFASEFGSGVGVMILDISIGAIFAALIPPQLRSRVSGAYLLVNNGVRPLGSLFGGALGTAIGVRPTLWIAALGGVAGFLWLLPSPIPRLKELPEEPETL